MEQKIISEFTRKANSIIYTYSDKIVLSNIPFLTTDIIRAHPNERWNLDSILERSYLTIPLLTIFKDSITDLNLWYKVCKNYSLSIDIVKEFRDELDIYHNAEIIVTHATLDIVDFIIEEYKDSISDLFDWISRNKRIDEKYVYKYYSYDWDWDLLSKTMIMSEQFIHDNHFIINFAFLANNPSFTINIFEKYRAKVLNWIFLSKNSDIMTLEFYKKYAHRIEINRVCHYSKYIIDIINDNPDDNWKWNHVCRNQYINIDFVKKYIHKPLDFNSLSCNPAIKLDDIIANPSLDWKWESISMHPELTVSFFTRYSYRDWNWKFINKYQTFSIEIQDIIKNIAATTIQRQLRICMYNPNYKMCKSILGKRYDDLANST